MADLIECRAGDLGTWAIGRTITGVDRDGNTVTLEVAELLHRPAAYDDEFVTSVRRVSTVGMHAYAVFRHNTTITIHPQPALAGEES